MCVWVWVCVCVCVFSITASAFVQLHQRWRVKDGTESWTLRICIYNILERSQWIKADIARLRSEMQKHSKNANTQILNTVVVVP